MVKKMGGDGIRKKACVACGGTGQLAYFQGVSRFLLTREECPQCGGTGWCIGDKPAGTGRGGKAPAAGEGGRRRKKGG